MMKKLILLTLPFYLVSCGDDEKKEDEASADTCECSAMFLDHNIIMEDWSESCKEWRKGLMKKFADKDGRVDMVGLEEEFKNINAECGEKE